MLLSQLFNEFALFSFLGWVYECIFCTFQSGKWQNRGFLFGPVCPIYGFCVVAGDIALRLIRQFGGVSGTELPWWQIFLMGMIGSAIVEYLTSWVLEKRFHAKWWDYSHLPLNLHGRISLLTSAAFGAAGILVARVLLPLMENVTVDIPPMLSEGVAMLLTALFGADIALTETSLNELLSRIEAAENELDTWMEARYKQLESGGARIREGGASVRQRAEDVLEHLKPGRAALPFLQRDRLSKIRTFTSESRNTVAEALKVASRRKKKD